MSNHRYVVTVTDTLGRICIIDDQFTLTYGTNANRADMSEIEFLTFPDPEDEDTFSKQYFFWDGQDCLLFKMQYGGYVYCEK